MPGNRQNQSNAVWNSSNGPADNIEEGVRAIKPENKNRNQVRDLAEQAAYPDRPGEPDCIYYLRTGSCGYGSNCRFNHPAHPAPKVAQYKGELPQRVGQPDCGYYLKTGTCKYGSTCKYHHPRDWRGAGQVTLNIFGLPMRQDEKSCPYYMRTFTCKFREACKFNHPQPASFETVLAVPGQAAMGSIDSSMLASAGLTYGGGLPAWSLASPQFMSGLQGAGPQTYIPFALPPSQSIMAGQDLNPFAGNLSPIPPNGIHGVNLPYISNDQGEQGINGQANNAPAADIFHLPERPDQPECRYFMSTGRCKYGTDCKYHHPKQRIAQLAMNSLGPHGLPLRPGSAACSYFGMYGICNYGPTCKFDHPVTGYFSNYGFSLPSPPLLNQSLFPIQGNLMNTNSSETAKVSNQSSNAPADESD
ncbi:hypothetical protein Nepgr_012852 [Nepenthes gracilis]|uniref:C3H1-type domain-containing protein n=1 Tax=Nepenthes gracilis TaxID=150966 RepID=A0AAD3XNR5_NEPGR|nr:hypothetical protein Nepgr_012852 [Nepenthes gracilis]